MAARDSGETVAKGGFEVSKSAWLSSAVLLLAFGTPLFKSTEAEADG